MSEKQAFCILCSISVLVVDQLLPLQITSFVALHPFGCTFPPFVSLTHAWSSLPLMLELKGEGFSSSIILSPLCLLLTLHSLKDPEIFPLDHLILVAKSENGKLLRYYDYKISLSLFVLLFLVYQLSTTRSVWTFLLFFIVKGSIKPNVIACWYITNILVPILTPPKGKTKTQALDMIYEELLQC